MSLVDEVSAATLCTASSSSPSCDSVKVKAELSSACPIVALFVCAVADSMCVPPMQSSATIRKIVFLINGVL